MKNELAADFMIYIGLVLFCTGIWLHWGFAVTAMSIGPVLIALGVLVSLKGKGSDG